MSDDTAWQSVRDNLKEAFGIDVAAGVPPGNPLTLTKAVKSPPSVPQVSEGFAFTPAPEDKTHFRLSSCEPTTRRGLGPS